MDLNKFIGKKYGDFIVLEVLEKNNNWHTSKFKVKCSVCGAILNRNGQFLHKNSIHSRFCYQGLYNNVPWKYEYSCRYANILRRCKTNIYYKNIECELKFHEFMEEMLKLQKENNLSNNDMHDLTIDRINNFENYKSGNLRLATKLTQVYNRRTKINCFIAKKGNKIALCNSSKMFAKYIGCSVGNVNNAVRGINKKSKNWEIIKINEETFNCKKNRKEYTLIFNKDYLTGMEEINERESDTKQAL